MVSDARTDQDGGKVDPAHWLSRLFDALPSVANASLSGTLIAVGHDPISSNVAGAALGEAFKSIGAEIESRILGPRERYRLGRAAGLIVDRIRAAYNEGEIPREDAFFVPGSDDRSAAHEIFESAFLAIQRDPEEKKLVLYANLVTWTAFDSRISRRQAYYLLALVERLSYRQLCLIALIADEEWRPKLRTKRFDEDPPMVRPWEWFGVLNELLDLCNLQLVEGDVAHLGIVDILPAALKAVHIGKRLSEMTGMGTKEVSELIRPDLNELLTVLGH